MELKIKRIVENELTGECIVTMEIYDKNLLREDFPENDNNTHLVNSISFLCNKDDIMERIKEESYYCWFNHVASMKPRPDLVKNTNFIIDDETGELKE